MRQHSSFYVQINTTQISSLNGPSKCNIVLPKFKIIKLKTLLDRFKFFKGLKLNLINTLLKPHHTLSSS